MEDDDFSSDQKSTNRVYNLGMLDKRYNLFPSNPDGIWIKLKQIFKISKYSLTWKFAK